jgi:TonB-dependent receptor
LNNTALKPWTAKSYDVSLEYYIHPNGIISAGVFRKDFDNFANARVFIPNDAELAEFGFDPAVYSGYTISTRTNGGAAGLTGADLNYSQLLTFLPSWARGVSIFANATILDVDGDNEADFAKFAPKIFNWGLRYNAHKFGANLRWNYRGLQRQSLLTSSNIAPGSTEYQRPRLQCDADVSYTFRPWLSVFAAARNLNNGRLVTQRYAPQTPYYARNQSYRDFGVLLTLGVKGQF